MRDENINLRMIKDSINRVANSITETESGILSLNFIRRNFELNMDLTNIVFSVLNYFTSDKEFASWILDINLDSQSGPLPPPVSEETERGTQDLYTLSAVERLSLYLRWV